VQQFKHGMFNSRYSHFIIDMRCYYQFTLFSASYRHDQDLSRWNKLQEDFDNEEMTVAKKNFRLPGARHATLGIYQGTNTSAVLAGSKAVSRASLASSSAALHFSGS
jgi:hypothetical protein